MNLRPRCREWMPLCTQQLRLRNLARIQGHNIVCSSNRMHYEAFIYYTLHMDSESAAFYTSEKLPQRHMEQKWAEIDAGDALRKSNSNCVCIKVWVRWLCRGEGTHNVIETERQFIQNTINGGGDNKERNCALTKQQTNNCLTPEKLTRPPEQHQQQREQELQQLLFTWAVYFSGLIPLSQQESDVKYRINCLVFQLNGEYFTSPAYITPEGLREQLSLNYRRYSASLPKPQSTQVKRDKFSINSPTASRSSSPVGTDLERDLMRMSTTRYTQLHLPAVEVRHSYDLKQLLKIQELQRLHLQKVRDCTEICNEIKRLSVRCITAAELRGKPRTTSISMGGDHQSHYYQHHSMGRTLSVLLAEQQSIEPLQLYNAQRLQLQIETLCSKKRLLQAERATYAERIVTQRQHLLELQQMRSEREETLQQQRTLLEKQRLQLLEELRKLSEQKVQKRHILQQVERRMSTLCIELREIYNVARKGASDVYSICGITLPNMELFVGDAQQRYEHHMSLEHHVSPLAISAALGYVAHLVQMISIIINRPLRNPIIYETSRTRIMDVVKELPYSSREFPLYTRSLLPSKPVKYAIYLLNQNIAQLCYDITGRRCDLRTPFENLLHIFSILEELEHNHRQIRDEFKTEPSQRLVLLADDVNETATGNALRTQLSATTNGYNGDDSLSKSHSSVDMNHVPVPPPATTCNTHPLPEFLKILPAHSQALAIEGFATTTQRVSRSVGSYSDCEEDFKNINEHTYSNSDSNIQFQVERS